MLTTDAVHPVERYNRYRAFHRLSTFRIDPDLRQHDEDGDPERRFRHSENRRTTDAKPPEADGRPDVRTAARRLVDVIRDLFRLQTTLVKLSAASPLSVWHAREAEAEPPGLVRVRAFRGAAVAEYRLRVLRCAEAHTYASWSFSALGKIPENMVGIHEIELETKKGVFRRTIVAFPTDSATQLFVKITSALHETQAGVRCRILRRTDAEGEETVSLVVRAAETGRTGSFSLRDVKGDLLARLGLDRPTSPAQDAEYLVNGSGPFASGANRIELDNRNVAIEWDSSFGQNTLEAVVRIRPDRAAVLRQLETVVGMYNRFRRTAAQLPGLLAEFDRMIPAGADGENAGIPAWGIVPVAANEANDRQDTDAPGLLRFDPERFLKAWEQAGYAPPEAVAGPQGWASRTYVALAELVSRTPDLLAEIVGTAHRTPSLYARDGRRVAPQVAPGLLFDYSSASPWRNA